jgi:hypothetical protein
MELIINGKARKIMYNKTDKYYYNSKDGKVDASKYFLKGDKVSSLNEGSLKKQYRKMLVGGGSNDELVEAKEAAYSRILNLKQILEDNKNKNNDNNDDDNKNNECDEAIQAILTKYFNKNITETTIKDQAIEIVNELNTIINSDLCKNQYNDNWKRKAGGKPPKKDLKTFLSKLRILIKEFE